MSASTSSAASAPSNEYYEGKFIKLLDESSPRVDQPSGPAGSPPVGIQLRPHQLSLLARCREFENDAIEIDHMPHVSAGVKTSMRTTVGIIGDKAGAGKSYVILSMVLEDKRRAALESENENEAVVSTTKEIPVVCSIAQNRIVLTSHETVSHTGITILVIPHNLCTQWMEYLNVFGGGLVSALVSKTRHLALLRPPLGNLDSLDLIVVTSTFYNEVTYMMHNRQVRRLVFDEADSVAIPNCHTIKAGFCWFATASYQNLLRPRGVGMIDGEMNTWVRTTLGLTSSGFIKTLFTQLDYSSVNRASAEALVVRNRDDFIDASITLPDPVITTVHCLAPRVVRVLAGFVNNQIMQHLNAGDVEGALQHINPNNRQTEESLVSILLQKLESEIHNYTVHLNMVPSLNFPNEEARQAEIVRITLKMDEVRARMNGIRERITSSDTCSICLNDLDNKTVVRCCSNAFCFSCISRWISQRQSMASCPLCNTRISLNDVLVVRDGDGEASSSEPSESSTPPSVLNEGFDARKDKLENFEALLRERCSVPGQNKLLVFSSFDNSFTDIVRVLDKVGIRWKYLKGNVAVISNIVREYRTGTLDVLLVNSQHCGSGSNFENTTDLVVWHKSDKNIEHQIIGRAQRSGRTCPLKLWYMVYDTERNNGVAST
jgi:hypothetical protein